MKKAGHAETFRLNLLCTLSSVGRVVPGETPVTGFLRLDPHESKTEAPRYLLDWHWVTKAGTGLQSFRAPPQPASRHARECVERYCERTPSLVLDAVICLEPRII